MNKRFFLIPFLVGLMLVLSANITHASENGIVDIQGVNISSMGDNQYQAKASIDFQLSETLAKALTHGVTLTAHIDFNLGKHRSWWWNSKNRVSRITYKLKYHALSKHYVLEKINSGQHWNFSSLPLALKQMGRIQNHKLPLLPPAINDGRHYLYITAKVVSESRSLPFKIQAYFTNSKYLIKSEGVLWALP